VAEIFKLTSKKTYTIGELARDFDVSYRTIRYYESIGLLSPERRGRTRIYDAYQRTKLRLILRGKRIGLSLRECEKLLHLYETDTGEEAQLLYLVWKIGERKTELEAMRRDIDASYADLDKVEQSARERLKELDTDDAVRSEQRDMPSQEDEAQAK
jgi:DNA-binding transcriptional MerR regulator